MATWGVLERNSLSGEQLPHMEAIPYVDPLITAKPYPAASNQGRGDSRRAMPWEALCRLWRYGPVTTDPLWRGSSPCHCCDVQSEHGKSMAGARRGLLAWPG